MDIEQLVSKPSWIVDPQGSQHGLCLGSIHVPRDVDQLRSLQIGAVLSVTSEEKNLVLSPEFRRLSIDLEDTQKEQIYNFFNTTYHFIDNNLRSTNVLVHCMAGVSRSATIVIAYIMKKYRMSLQ